MFFHVELSVGLVFARRALQNLVLKSCLAVSLFLFGVSQRECVYFEREVLAAARCLVFFVGSWGGLFCVREEEGWECLGLCFLFLNVTLVLSVPGLTDSDKL